MEAEVKTMDKKEEKPAVETTDNKVEERKETLNEKEAEEKKEIKKEIKKKEVTYARGFDLHASKKHCMYICNFIKNKNVDTAIQQLNEVINKKRAIPFKGEIPHRKGMMSGRYPVNASKEFIYLLKGLRGNILVNGMDLDKTRIVTASANWSSRPQRRGGGRFKRTNVLLIVKETAK